MSAPVVDARVDKLAQLRQRIAAVSSASRANSIVPQRQQSSVSSLDEHHPQDVLAVSAALSPLFPGGGLVRGTVTEFAGASSVLLSIVAEVTAAGGQVAVIGRPQLCLAAAADMGADLSRIGVVPDPGADPVEIAAVLLDGMDLVVLGLGGMSVPPSRSRVVTARARGKGAALMVVDGRWSGARLKVHGTVCGYRHLPDRRPGYGRIGGYTLTVRTAGKGFAGADGRVDVCFSDGRMRLQPSVERIQAAPTDLPERESGARAS
ncbi:hypothetical protein [Jongsikchunia kroppenstedtii]|uniref:hypothetical protein n=1 Tax=Jongsikchunia kroppenstedtii TaxID=1121721 RepID=UPI0003825D1F|nr:hypothetical protein [Jongsikchunia kroppenstedtii]